MPERIERGLWPHPPLKFSAVVGHLAQVLKSEKWFPREWKPAVPGESIWEGGVIERKLSGYISIGCRGVIPSIRMCSRNELRKYSYRREVRRNII